jgi:hypothetical protein
MRAGEIDQTYRDIGKDKLNQAHFDDTRKVGMTLRNLNKLKKMRAAQDLENHMRMDTLEIIYGPPPEEEGGGGGL